MGPLTTSPGMGWVGENQRRRPIPFKLTNYTDKYLRIRKECDEREYLEVESRGESAYVFCFCAGDIFLQLANIMVRILRNGSKDFDGETILISNKYDDENTHFDISI